MNTTAESNSYVILTDITPIRDYNLEDKYILKSVQTSTEMYEGTLFDAEESSILLALPCIDGGSISVYKDLVIFHTFISGYSPTYIFAETAHKVLFPNSRLLFIHDTSTKDLRIVDFNSFPVEIYEDMDIQPETQYINYKQAFRKFRELQTNRVTRKLYDQIRLYIYAKGMVDINKIYTNTYLTLSLYVTILESIIGCPPKCDHSLTCSKCDAKITEHFTKSLDKYFKEHYPALHKKSRGIRHSTYHQGVYFDLTQSLVDSDWGGEEDDAKLDRHIRAITNLEDTLEFQVQKELTELFLNFCQNRIIK